MINRKPRVVVTDSPSGWRPPVVRASAYIRPPEKPKMEPAPPWGKELTAAQRDRVLELARALAGEMTPAATEEGRRAMMHRCECNRGRAVDMVCWRCLIEALGKMTRL